MDHHHSANQNQQLTQKWNVFVWGGTEFMGRFLVQSLLDKGHKVTIANRGNKYWGKKNPFKIPATDPEALTRYTVDREDAADLDNFLKTLIQIKNLYFDLVVDFTAFHKEDMEPCVKYLSGKVGHYIYISTDSVYEVCAKPNHPGGRREEDSKRPTDPKERAKLADEDDYGEDKFQVEELLQEAYTKSAFPYTALRLPDVFGPFDSSNRFWKYYLWVIVSNKVPIDLTKKAETHKLSFVYVQDVVNAIYAVTQIAPKSFGQAYNIAQSETPTLPEFLQVLGNAVGVKPKFYRIEMSDDEGSDDGSEPELEAYYPSVTFGPVDISKALKNLPWKPTAMQTSIRESCAWFEKAWHNYRTEREEAIEDFSEQMLDLLFQKFGEDEEDESGEEEDMEEGEEEEGEEDEEEK